MFRPGVALRALLIAAGIGWLTWAGTHSTPVQAGISAAGESVLYACNLSPSQGATTVVDFYRTMGPFVQSLNLAVTPPLGAAEVDLSQTTLPTGAYAAVVASDRPLDALTLLSWPASGGAILSVAPHPSSGSPAVVLVPGLTTSGNQGSLVSIHNGDASQSAVLTVRAIDESGTVQLTQDYSIPPGTAITLDTSADVEFAALGGNFAGSLVLESANPIAVEQIVDLMDSAKAVYSVSGIPIEEASTDLALPLAVREAALGPGAPIISSRVALVNTGGAPTDVTIEYSGTSGACAGQSFQDQVTQVPAGGSRVIPQNGGNLPAGCLASARMSASEPVVATVALSDSGRTFSAGYEAYRASDGDTAHILPRFHRTAGGWTTAVAVHNTTGVTANVSYTLADKSGASLPCPGCSAQIPGGEGLVIWLGDVPGLQDGSAGLFTLSSDTPVHAAAVDVPVGPGPDMTSARLCSTSGAVLPGPASSELIPLLLMRAGGPPQATATPLPTLPATATPPVTGTLPSTATLAPTMTIQPPGTATPTPVFTETPVPTVAATDTPQATATPVAPTPTETPVPGVPGAPLVGPGMVGRAPAAAVAAALANPNAVYGWGMPRNPSLPYDPVFNPYRTCLQLRNMGVPYHPIFNPLVYTAGC